MSKYVHAVVSLLHSRFIIVQTHSIYLNTGSFILYHHTTTVNHVICIVVVIKEKFMRTNTKLILMSCGGILKYVSKAFSGFSVGCCINREVICYQLEFGK